MSFRTIGLLGGSFNPAHAGHRQISVEALKRLGLDEVWWLVSPANPLKEAASLANYELRLGKAKAVAGDRRIKVLDFERRAGTRYSIDTIRVLKRRYPGVRFVWLMGADNLAGFHRWRSWREIAREIGIVVFDRKPYTHAALRGKAALALASARLPAGGRQAPKAGQWRYIFERPIPLSATVLRKTLGEKAFWPHNGDGQPLKEFPHSNP